jgi:hypothetical protein
MSLPPPISLLTCVNVKARLSYEAGEHGKAEEMTSGVVGGATAVPHSRADGEGGGASGEAGHGQPDHVPGALARGRQRTRSRGAMRGLA